MLAATSIHEESSIRLTVCSRWLRIDAPNDRCSGRLDSGRLHRAAAVLRLAAFARFSLPPRGTMEGMAENPYEAPREIAVDEHARDIPSDEYFDAKIASFVIVLLILQG